MLLKLQANNKEKPDDTAIAKGGVACPFPWRLHEMLEAVEREGLEHIVSWQPHGRAFMVKKPKEFVDKILARFFSQTKYPSFQRQLNMYGFARFAHGLDKGAYFHSCFVRGERSLVRGMVRRKIKGTKVRRTMSPNEEPDFYALQHELENPATPDLSPEDAKEPNFPEYGYDILALPEMEFIEDTPFFRLDSLEEDIALQTRMFSV